MDPILSNILTYLTELCQDPKIWGKLMCTSKTLYDNLIEKFLIKKFRFISMGISPDPKKNYLSCPAYLSDFIYKTYSGCNKDYYLTTNPRLIELHAMIDCTCVHEIFGFYLPFVKLSDDCYDSYATPDIEIKYEQVLKRTLTSTLYPMLSQGIRNKIAINKTFNIISLEESRNITNEVITNHYSKYLNLNNPNYKQDIELIELRYQISKKHLSDGFSWENRASNLSRLKLNVLQCIPNCIYCGEIHEKKN
jgi:hypothetical protein